MPQRSKSVIRSAARVFLILALSLLLFVGQTTYATTGLLVGLANTVIGIGGRGDATSANIPAKLNHGVVPGTYTYDPIHYPASIELSKSTKVSGPLVYNALTTLPTQQFIVAGYSEGTLGAEAAKRQLLANHTGPTSSELSFLMIASPFAGNGGIFARFPGVSVPFIVNNMGPSKASPYDTTFVTNEYDPYADFPAYFNPIALANSLLGVVYAHPDAYYDGVTLGTTPSTTTQVTNSAGGHDTYVFVYNKDLPLLAPLRAGAGALGLTPFVKPLLDAVQPLLRVAIDMAYTDRTNAHPAVNTPFSLFTPLPRVIWAIGAIPGAIGQGINNFFTDIRNELTPAAGSAATTTVTAATATPKTSVPATTAPKTTAPKVTAPKAVAAASPSSDPPPPAKPKRPLAIAPKNPTTKNPTASTDANGSTKDTTDDPAPQPKRTPKAKSGSSKTSAAKAA